MHPARAAPRFSASTAAPDSEPKLMADTLTTDAGRKAPAPPPAAPSPLAPGRPPAAGRPEHLGAGQLHVVSGRDVRRRDGAAERPVVDDRIAGRVLEVVV